MMAAISPNDRAALARARDQFAAMAQDRPRRQLVKCKQDGPYLDRIGEVKGSTMTCYFVHFDSTDRFIPIERTDLETVDTPSEGEQELS